MRPEEEHEFFLSHMAHLMTYLLDTRPEIPLPQVHKLAGELAAEYIEEIRAKEKRKKALEKRVARMIKDFSVFVREFHLQGGEVVEGSRAYWTPYSVRLKYGNTNLLVSLVQDGLADPVWRVGDSEHSKTHFATKYVKNLLLSD